MLSEALAEHFGTCHRHPPAHVPFDMADLPNTEADREEMKRWPTVFRGDLCGEHAWRCQARGCHEAAIGSAYCLDHQSARIAA